MTGKNKLDKAEQDFVDRMGIVAEGDGLARITGRIWGLLIVTGDPLTSAEIADLLVISRGSVSTNIRTLEALEIIEKRTVAGDRSAHYAMCKQPYALLISAQMKRFPANRRIVEQAAEAIDRPDVRERLNDLSSFYALLENAHGDMLKTLEKRSDQ